MFAVCLSPAAATPQPADSSSQPHHTHVAFSFDAASRTDLLSVSGDVFTHVTVPGFDHGSYSLRVGDVHGRWLVQATPAAVNVVAGAAGGGAGSVWRPPTGGACR